MTNTYMNETVGVRLPNGESVALRIPVKYTEDDIDVARRTAKNFPPGTIIKVDTSRFKVTSQEPVEVVELGVKTQRPKPTESDEPASEKKPKLQDVPVAVGQRWVTKDARRKQEPFEVVKIEGDAVVTDKGAKIGLHRMNRYRLVS